MIQIKDTFENPSAHQPKELFDILTKFALLIFNQHYDEEYITLGDLPAVADDMKKAR